MRNLILLRLLISSGIALASTGTSAKTAQRHPAKTKAPARTSAPAKLAPKVERPGDFVALRATKVLAALKSRPVRPVELQEDSIELRSQASKTSWLESVYDKNLVEASWSTEMLSDRRIFAAVLERELRKKAEQYVPKTLGLREFLSQRRLIDAKGVIVADGETVENALYEEFPSGFFVRPAVGVAPQETSRGLFPDTDSFIIELFKPDNTLYSPAHMVRPIRSHILNAVASGEAVILQENFVAAADAKKPLKSRHFREVRVHTYEGRVVAGAVPSRWVQENSLSKEEIERAEAYVGEMLASLPVQLLTRQAWGVDVAVMDNGMMRVTDVVTNRGKQISWSGYLDQPRVIGAYARHFETHYGCKFKGLSGTLIRHGFANYLAYWGKRIEKAKPGWGKVTAYLPPVP